MDLQLSVDGLATRGFRSPLHGIGWPGLLDCSPYRVGLHFTPGVQFHSILLQEREQNNSTGQNPGTS